MEPTIFWGDILRRVRLAYGLTQKEVADILHIDRQTYSHYETGRTRPTPEILTILSNIYDVNFNSFVNKCMPKSYVAEQIVFKQNLPPMNINNKRCNNMDQFDDLYNRTLDNYDALALNNYINHSKIKVTRKDGVTLRSKRISVRPSMSLIDSILINDEQATLEDVSSELHTDNSINNYYKNAGTGPRRHFYRKQDDTQEDSDD